MTLRAIDVSGLDRPAVATTERPELRFLAIHSLRIDETYQRPLGKRGWNRIRAIAGEFDWSRFTPVVAAPLGDGSYALIDGQHRSHAAALVGARDVPAMIVSLDATAQAAAFGAINANVTAMTAFHVYRAALAAGDGWAVACDRVVRDAGCQLMTANASSTAKKPGQVYAIGLIRRHVAAGRGDMVTAALRPLTAGSCAHADYFANRVLEPWFKAFQDDSDLLGVGLERFLEAHDLRRIEARVDRMRQQPAYAHQSRYKLGAACIAALLRAHGRTTGEVAA